ncbi:MAG TPA: T9SS type A sorting domain-containing protein, partial [Bacteroidetes bacterium]|nr:T9SS type A sorting domain-containing protein [Bacteroidota bacterium]
VACAGDPVCFEVEVENETGVGDVYYRWEFSLDGISWVNLTSSSIYSGQFNGEFCIQNTTGLYGIYYRCRAYTSNCDVAYSGIFHLNLNGPYTFSQQPEDVEICIDDAEEVSFSAEVEYPFPSFQEPDYQWQMSADHGNSWEDVDADQPDFSNTFSGINTNLLSVKTAIVLSGYQFRLRAFAGDCEEYSEPATMTISDRPCLFTNGWPNIPYDEIDLPTDGDEDLTMLVAPNPAHDEIFVSISQSTPEGKASIKVLNLQGQVIDVQTIDLKNRLQLDLQKYLPGIYFLVLERGGKILGRSRFVKQ